MKKKGNYDNFKNVIKSYFNLHDAFLIPNVLCYVRVFLMIVFAVLYNLSFNTRNQFTLVYISTGIMVLALYTDFLDGFIARKFNMNSMMGSAIDPICDKLSLLCIVIAIVIRFHEYILVDVALILFLVKELWLTISVILLARRNVSYEKSKWYGKVSSFICYLSFGIILMIGPSIVENSKKGILGLNTDILFMNILSIISIFFLLLGFVGYLFFFIKLFLKGG